MCPMCPFGENELWFPILYNLSYCYITTWWNNISQKILEIQWKVGHNKTCAQCAQLGHIIGHKVGHIWNLIVWPKLNKYENSENVQGWLLTCFVFPIIYNLIYWTQHGELTYHDFQKILKIFENSWNTEKSG